MNAIRIVLGVVGGLLLIYGVSWLVHGLPRATLLVLIGWLAAAVIIQLGVLTHEVLIWYIQSNGLIDLKPHDSGKGDCVEAIDPFDDSLFTDEELQVLEDVCARFKSSTAKGMTKVSHLEDAYVRTQMKEPISYDYAMNLKAIQ